jgi:uncharacterized protein (TIGR02266 family)
MVAAEERRYHPRADVKWPVSIQTAYGTVEEETLNVSTAGVFVCCQRPSGLGKNFRVTIDIPHLNRTLTATVEIAWSRIFSNDKSSPVGMGLRFMKISNEDRDFISNRVKHFLRLEEVNHKSTGGTERIVLDPEDNS